MHEKGKIFVTKTSPEKDGQCHFCPPNAVRKVVFLISGNASDQLVLICRPHLREVMHKVKDL